HLLQVIAAAEVVWADETPMRVLDVKQTRQGYLWTFLTQTPKGEWLIGYRFSLGRASTTPKDVLGGTRGALVVDAYTGYNAVTLPEGRVRVGCWAHVRRRFFEALPTAPEAREALDFILALYRVEAQARDAGLVRTASCASRRVFPSSPRCAPGWRSRRRSILRRGRWARPSPTPEDSGTLSPDSSATRVCPWTTTAARAR
ncbi:transposase, partial [Corallococcus sp. ZKHCc1 1396]|nr:transposase [Corallococcus soli]